MSSDEHTPDYLRNDRALLQEFPPRPLEGLCDGWLNWRRVPKARDRRMLALGADADARSAAGLRAHRLTDRGFYCTRLAILATASPLPASASTGFEPQQGCEV